MDQNYQITWAREISKRLSTLKKHADLQKKKIIFTISSTSKTDPHNRPYLTPLRETATDYISGVVVRSLDQGILASLLLDGLVDRLYVDVEAKKGLLSTHDPELFESMNLKPLHLGQEGVSLFQVVSKNLKKTIAYPFKPNDLTVESVWFFITSKIPVGTGILIVGAGNIGFKLALKLTETGYPVSVHRRQTKILEKFVEVLLSVRPPLTSTPVEVWDGKDLPPGVKVLVGVSDGIPVIHKEMVEALPLPSLVLDVGKGTVSSEAIESCHRLGHELYRTDITCGLDAFVSGDRRNYEIQNFELGRREVLPGISIISGGYLGKREDVIVDNYLDPKHIVGMADGLGDLVREPTTTQIEKIEKVKIYILERLKEKINV